MPGVGEVEIFGSQYAMRIWVKPDQLAKLNITIPEIINAVQAQNAYVPAGQVAMPPMAEITASFIPVRSRVLSSRSV